MCNWTMWPRAASSVSLLLLRLPFVLLAIVAELRFAGGDSLIRPPPPPDIRSPPSSAAATSFSASHAFKLAQSHPLCETNVTAYAGQTAKMHCCLARLDRELSISWIRQQDVVVLTHGDLVFTSDNRFEVSDHDGVWGLNITKVGREDAGVYVCQTDDPDMGTVSVRLDIKDTKAEILGPPSRYVKSGSSIRLSCRVYFGPDGPDDDYRRSAVMHWFHGQRLLDPAVDNVGNGGSEFDGGKSEPRISMGRELSPTELSGWIRVDSATHYDAGNYTCVPSYATPAWTDVHILHEENQASLHKEVSEVKVDVSSTSGPSPQLATSFSAFSFILLVEEIMH